MSDNIDIDLGQYQNPIDEDENDNQGSLEPDGITIESAIKPDEIVIEITGLKSFGTFIGLEDTPIYYDNGKFFKIENNKVVYTDIKWKDITGDISDQPELQKLIEKSVEEYSEDFIRHAINIHDTNVFAHESIRNTITQNYEELSYKIEQNSENINNLALKEEQDYNTLDEKIDGINANLTQEIDELQQDVNEKYDTLVDDIDDLSTIVDDNYTTLDNKIDTTKTELQTNIDTLSETVQQHYTDLTQDINDLVDTVNDNKQSADQGIANANTRIDTLTQTVQDLDTNLSKDIDDLDIKLSGEISDLSQDLNDEMSARENADTTLQNNINTLSQTVQSNYTTLDTKINGVDNRLTEVAEEINQTIEDNVTALQQADAGLQTQITTNKNDIADLTQVVQDDYTELDTAIKAEETRAKGVEENLQQQLTSETTNRENADTNLQEQIDAITSSSDVKDIVGTYAELQNYDKTTLGDNDIIKVLKDETKENASTYYKYILSTQSFQYIGAEGPFYTKSEADNKFVPQTRTVNNKALTDNISLTYTDVNALPDTTFIPTNVTDLDDNANYTKYSDFTDSNSIDFTSGTNSVKADIKISQDTENIVSISTDGILAKHQNISHLATKEELTNGLATKQDTLTPENAGEGIKIENGIISNTRTSAEWGNITGTISEQVDLQQELNKKQDVLTAGNNITILNNVISSQDTITEVDDVTIIYNSENKLEVSGNTLQSGGYQKYWEGTKLEFNSIAVKDPNTLYQVLDDEETALFEVDGTTIEFSNDEILQIPSNVDLCIEEGLYGGGESGYRKYRNGHLEQWGKVTSSANGVVEFTMHKPYKDTTFSIFAQVSELGNFFIACFPSANQKFKLRIQTSSASNIAVRVSWYSIGRWK